MSLTPLTLINEFTALPGLDKGELGETLTQTGKALLAWDTWKEDPARALGNVLFNVVATVGTGGAGAALKTTGTAGRIAEVLAAGGRATRVADLASTLKLAMPELRLSRLNLSRAEGADLRGSALPTPRGLSAGDEVFHYTRRQFVESIQDNGLRPGAYATPNGALSPLQAHIELSLPPNTGLRDGVLRVDVGGLRRAGYDIPQVTRVSNVVRGPGDRVYSMPGGGYEMLFPYPIPPEFIKVAR